MDVGLSLVAGIVPAVISGVLAFVVARHNFRSELDKLSFQLAHERAAEFASLRQRYINPLRYWAFRLARRLEEVDEKFASGSYDEVRGWFRNAKNHADRTSPMPDFAGWCYYVGIFAMTTLYYTCSYIKSARDIQFRLPFSELDQAYSAGLDQRLGRVSAALGGLEGIWDSTQEVVGERFTAGEAKLDNEELCRIMDSGDRFRIAPFVRLLDFYIDKLDRPKAAAIKGALDELIAYLDSERTPEAVTAARTRSARAASGL